jgi:hypothetical protein
VVWDGENRPSSITEGALTHQFVYGPDGARLKKRVPITGGFNETLYLGADLERSPAGVWSKYGRCHINFARRVKFVPTRFQPAAVTAFH